MIVCCIPARCRRLPSLQIFTSTVAGKLLSFISILDFTESCRCEKCVRLRLVMWEYNFWYGVFHQVSSLSGYRSNQKFVDAVFVRDSRWYELSPDSNDSQVDRFQRFRMSNNLDFAYIRYLIRWLRTVSNYPPIKYSTSPIVTWEALVVYYALLAAHGGRFSRAQVQLLLLCDQAMNERKRLLGLRLMK